MVVKNQKSNIKYQKFKTYILSIKIREDTEIPVGALGRVFFKKGYYIYIGSAKGRLEARLRRHRHREKRVFWHIDYLLMNREAKISEVWVAKGSIECKTAAVFNKASFAEIVKKGFGSSDCRCPSHLFYLKDSVGRVKSLLKGSGFRKIE